MPKYDAFGREIGEDPLAGLGWTTGGPVPPSRVPPATAPSPPDAPPPRPTTPTVQRPPRRRRSSGGARIMSRLITFGIFIAIAAAVIPNVTTKVKDATDGLKIDIPDVQTPAIPDTKPAKPPVGLGDGS